MFELVSNYCLKSHTCKNIKKIKTPFIFYARWKCRIESISLCKCTSLTREDHTYVSMYVNKFDSRVRIHTFSMHAQVHTHKQKVGSYLQRPTIKTSIKNIRVANFYICTAGPLFEQHQNLNFKEQSVKYTQTYTRLYRFIICIRVYMTYSAVMTYSCETWISNATTLHWEISNAVCSAYRREI